MLDRKRIGMNAEEASALERLIEREEAQGKSLSLTRTEPGNKGPIRVEIGNEAWHIDGGSFRKQAD